MTIEEIKLRRLANQHLLTLASYRTVAQDLCGVQAQFLSNAFHALRIRSNDFDESSPTGLMKSWTLRGTMHLFDADDLPLMLYRDRTHVLRPCDTLCADEWITAERKRFFADLIVQAVGKGTGEREALKQICADAGMTEQEAQSVFNSWGGLVRALCEEGTISHAVGERKAFIPCPPFEPMEKNAAQLELARRYFTHYGPATVRDAAYFFGCRQSDVRRWLNQLPVQEAECMGRTYYDIEESAQAIDEIPACIFLAGFDPLMLGYDKTENPFLPEEHLRGIFTLAGIVMPAVVLLGRVVGKWKRTGKKLDIMFFEPVSSADREIIHCQAERTFKNISVVNQKQ